MYKMNLLRDFEETLARLIENQEALNAISKEIEFSFEKEVLLKTQESLKAHFIFLSDLYPKEKQYVKGSYLQEQLLLQKFSYLKQISKIDVKAPFESRTHLRKRRFKKLKSL